MAKIIASKPFSKTTYNFSNPITYETSRDFNPSSFQFFNEKLYIDHLVVYWNSPFSPVNFASVFAGNFLQVDFLDRLTGGEVTGYYTFIQEGNKFVLSNALEDFSVPAAEIYEIAATRSIADDDGFIFNQILHEGDFISLGIGDDDALGGSGEDFMLGGAGRDILSGGGDADYIVGGEGNDFLFGDAGDDLLQGGPGDDVINGGSGFDELYLLGNRKAFTIRIGPSEITVDNRMTSGTGIDQISSIELISFGLEDQLELSLLGGMASLNATQLEDLVELYIAYFNRAPDALGLNFWGTSFANGTSLEEMASLFVGQDETLAAYPLGTSNEVFANIVYNNVLGRTPDQDGLNFWVEQIENRSVSRDEFILEVLKGVQVGSPDRAYLDDKVDVGAYFSVHKGMSDTENAASVMALFDDQGVGAAVNAIDSHYQDALSADNGELLFQVIGILDDPFNAA